MEGSQGVDRFPVNLTVNLGKTYDVTYIRLKFQSPRPASFAIYKKIRPDPALPGLVAKNIFSSQPVDGIASFKY